MPYAHARRVLPPAAAVLLLLAGCATSRAPLVAPLPEPEPARVEPLVSAPTPAPAPRPAPPVRPTPAPPRAEIALVLDTSTPAHASVAEEIDAALPPRLYEVSRFNAAEADALEGLRARSVTVVAVGPDAVRAARAALPAKALVFCQIAAADEAFEGGGPTWGVQTLPPLALQLKSWQAIDPTLRTIALIVSASGAPLAAEARRAAEALAADLVVETSSSDRETLYLFRRLATTIDGLWLLPDNDALSPQVLREMLSYASARGIGVLTFNEALLSRGALLAATAVPADVAATVAHVVERVVSGRTAELLPLTPLSAAAFTINPGVATTFGLPPVAERHWIVREPD